MSAPTSRRRLDDARDHIRTASDALADWHARVADAGDAYDALYAIDAALRALHDARAQIVAEITEERR